MDEGAERLDFREAEIHWRGAQVVLRGQHALAAFT